ncbi:aldolase [Candidatus Peregrinibacteria bacterium]|nr:aldolase [Candidatus Peregrinibacteria bacterium]
MPKPSFKTKIRTKSNAPLLGIFLQIPGPDIAEIVGHAGFDFSIIDTEHGMFGVDSAIQLVRACDAVGMASVIRVPFVSHTHITQALDFGVSTVMVPRIETPEDARQAVAAAKFYPDGNRGVCPFTRAASYNALDEPDYYKRSNADTAVLLQIEGHKGIANLDAILEVPNIDGILIGPFDLSHSLGIPGKVDDIRVIKAFKDIIKQAEKRGIAVGNFAVTLKQAHRYIDMGIRFLAFGADTIIMSKVFSEIRKCILTKSERNISL